MILYRQFADFRNGERADGGAEIQAELKGAATLGGEWKAVEEASAAARLASRSSRRAGYISFTFAVQLHWLAIRGLAPHYVIMCFDIPTDMV